MSSQNRTYLDITENGVEYSEDIFNSNYKEKLINSSFKNQ